MVYVATADNGVWLWYIALRRIASQVTAFGWTFDLVPIRELSLVVCGQSVDGLWSVFLPEQCLL